MRTLAWIALGGIGLGAASLSLAFALDGPRIEDQLLDLSLGSRCADSDKQTTTSQRERHLAWQDGDEIDLALPGTVRYRGGEGSEIVVRGAPELIAHVEVKRGRLTLNCRSSRDGRSFEVTLPGRTFRRIGIAGSGKLVMENVNQPELAFSIAGSGSVRAQGVVAHATVKVAGSGQARLADLAVNQLTVDIAGSGKVEANPKDSADITISGSGDVKLLNRPAELRTKISGSGRINQAAEK